MVAADEAGQQQQAIAETDTADVESMAEKDERQNQDAQAARGEVGSRGGGSRGGGAVGVRSGGGVREGGADGALEDEAAVGSIHHILKTAFKELYGEGEKEENEQASAAAAGQRQGVSAGASGSASGRRPSSSTEGAPNAEGEATLRVDYATAV